MKDALDLCGGGESGTAEAMNELRAQRVTYILAFTAAGHFFWHLLFTATSGFELSVKAWILFPFIVGGELVSYRLVSSRQRGATSFFVLWALFCTTGAIWLFQAPRALFLFPLVALVAAIVVHPLAGFLVVGGEGGLSGLFSVLAPTAPLGPGELGLAVLAAALTVLISWTSTQSEMVAVRCSMDSYEQARRNLRDAQEHRGKLVQAMKQLDTAYYYLQRANVALAAAWRAAEEAERAKAEFVTNISHELRTPLNLIVGFSEMMISAPESYGGQPLPREYRGDLHAIYRSAEHLLAITDDILDLAQAEVNRLALVREPSDLAQTVRESVDMVREYIEAKELELRLSIQNDLPCLDLDRLRIRQILLNLLTNAVRHTERGCITVDVAIQNAEVLVSVADTGRGIPPEKLTRIFEEFHHVDDAAAREHKSTGLGIPISKKFVELHQGRMWVESELGVGTVFRFTLPIADGAHPQDAPGVRQSHLVHAVAGERILVLAQENPSLQRLFQRRLGTYRVVGVPKLEQATALAYELRATAIVADLAAPDCVESRTPIIRCPLPGEQQRTGPPRVVEHLVKPVARADLRTAIDRLDPPVHKILVVDDDIRAVRLITRMLRTGEQDYQVLAAHNGDEALSLIRVDPPDLVILDLVMPVRNGQEVLETMAAEAGLAAIPVIIVSAHSREEEMLPLVGELRISKPDGWQLAEMMAVVEATLTALAPPRAYLTGRGTGRKAGQPG